MSPSHTRSKSRTRGDALELYVESLLDALRDEGHVIEQYHLLRARHYPDFWAKDAKGREWLLECKNKVPKVLKPPIKHFQDDSRFTEEYLWTERNILTKNWNLPAYETRPEKPKKHGEWITVRDPKPILITRSCHFDGPSLAALEKLFGLSPRTRIITFGERGTLRADFAFIHERLRKYFTER